MPKQAKKYAVLTYPDEVLTAVAVDVKQVDSEVRSLIREMFKVMYRDRGVGLAAPQIGVSKRIFVANPTGEKGGPEYAFVNPHISQTQGEAWGPEGCLSLPGLSAAVPRAESLHVEALDEKGEPVSLDADDFLARIIQHESDHLNGKLFIDRIAFTERQKLLAVYLSKNRSTDESIADESRFFRFL